jgi:ketopantoate reductase
MMDSMGDWQEKVERHIRGAIGFVRGCVFHHWHGASEHRGYEKRWSIMSFHRFDPSTDIAEDTNGLFKWAGNKPRLEDDIRFSLSARNEDAL